MSMTIARQIEIMEAQISNFETLVDKMHYMSICFDPDPEYTQEARDIVRSNVVRKLDEDTAMRVE